MTDQDKKRLRLIAKLLALTNSPNKNEANSAKRHAEELMNKYSFNENDVHYAEINEFKIYLNRKTQAPMWLNVLANSIAILFQCLLSKLNGNIRFKTYINFIGLFKNAENAGYVFNIVHRLLLAERRKFIKTIPRQTKATNKRKRADVFCEHFVLAVYQTISSFAKDITGSCKALQQYKQNYLISRTDPRTPESKKNNRGYRDAAIAGKAAGTSVDLLHGIQNNDRKNTIKQLGSHLD